MKFLQASPRRAGNILVLSLVLMIPMLGMLAFSIDVGYMNVVKTELQRTADASALAGAWQLIDPNAIHGSVNSSTLLTKVKTVAANYSTANQVLHENPVLDPSDVQVGYIANPFSPSATLTTAAAGPFNAVRVTIHRDDIRNGNVPLFFARAIGIDEGSFQAEATAVVLSNIKGFSTPGAGGNLDLLPYALDQETWAKLLAGNASDKYRFDASTKAVTTGTDGILEVNLFPQGTGSPGNRGTVDIGSSNNSTADIRRQIREGISSADLAYLGGKIELGPNGTLNLNGDTGISAGVQNDFQAIVGETRIIPLFSSVTGPGNNAVYSIVGFAGVRVMNVKLTGSQNSKQVIVQPANVMIHGAIPGNSTTSPTTFVYTPAWLAR